MQRVLPESEDEVNVVEAFFWATLGVCGWEFGKWMIVRFRWQYRWKCPRCNFKLKTNNRETFEISKSSHNHITEDYK